MAFQPEYDKLGLKVSDDELVDMVQGDNISPGIKQAFTDQKTGQFDKARLIDYLKNLDKLPPKGAILIAAPLKFVNGTGSPIRALALVPRG